MSDNRRSKTVTQGVQRSPNRAMLRAVGFGDKDFDKPIVGVANAHSTITPCNMGIGALADRADAGAEKGRRDAAGVRHDHDLGRHLDGHRGDEISRWCRAR